MITDQVNNFLYFSTPPKRIVSLVPSLTELLVDLGLEEYIIGVTKFCVHPSHIRKTKTIVGGTKNIKLDKIKDLAPDFILCNKEENNQEIVETCQRLAPTYVSDIYTLEDVYSLIKDLGDIFEIHEACENMNQQLYSLYHIFQKECSSTTQVPVAYFIWKSPWMVAGNQTFIHHMLSLCNFRNVFERTSRYPEIAMDEIPEETKLLLLSSEPFPFSEKHTSEIKESHPTKKIVIVNGEYFSWYGSRLLKAIDYFKRLKDELNN